MTAPCAIVLMTRPRDASDGFLAELAVDAPGRFTGICSPLIDIAARGPLPDLTRYRGLIFTSANGVAAFQAFGGAGHGTAYSVGDATALAAQGIGMDAISAKGDAEALIAFVRDSGATGPLLHLRGVHSQGNIAHRLIAAGIPTDEAVIYDQTLRPLTTDAQVALQSGAPIIAPLYSVRTAGHFVDCVLSQGPLYLVAMSRRVAETLKGLPHTNLIVAAQPTGAAMKKAALDSLDLVATLEADKRAQ